MFFFLNKILIYHLILFILVFKYFFSNERFLYWKKSNQSHWQTIPHFFARRSFKDFNEEDFNNDISNIPFHASYVFEDPDDVYWAHETLIKEVLDEHAPIKERRSKSNKPAFMNSELRSAIYKKRMLRNKYFKCRSSQNWEKYRKRRNYVTKLKRQSLRVYFFERCHGGPKSKDFWPTIKPFLSKKGSKDDPTIILNEEEKILSDQKTIFS